MLMIYKRVTKEELQKSVEEAIPKIEQWFQNNPKRRVCKVQLWYGKNHTIKRKDVREQVEAIAAQIETAKEKA